MDSRICRAFRHIVPLKGKRRQEHKTGHYSSILTTLMNNNSFIHSFHLFCKNQLTERNCTIKLENRLKYYNSSNMQLQIKLPVQIGLTV